MFNIIFYQPILNLLILLSNLFAGNLGFSIIVLTLFIRALLIPLMSPQLKSAQKMQSLAPELEKLKAKYQNDKQKFAQAQLELYKKHGINPAAGCLPSILQFFILIALFQVFTQVIKNQNDPEWIKNQLYPFVSFPSFLNFKFLYLDLAKPDLISLSSQLKIPGLFVLLATVFQFLSSKLISPSVQKIKEEAKSTPEKTDDLSASMQKQMLYLFPAMTLIFGYTMPSGVILYWFTFSFFSYLQQVIISKKTQPKIV